MSKILLVFALLPFFAKAQQSDINKQFRTYKIVAYTGAAVSVAGVITTAISAINLVKDEVDYNNGTRFVGQTTFPAITRDKNFLYTGIGLTAAGIILDIIAIHHIGKLKLVGNGVAINL